MSLSRYRQALVPMFQRVRELAAEPIARRLLALQLQEELLTRIGRSERIIRQTRAKNAVINAQLGKRGNDRQTSGQLKILRARGEERIRQQKELLSVLRAVGDAIAFIYGDRFELKQYTRQEQPGFISGKRGTRLERSILRRVFDEGFAAVLNDLTHTLRHGDVTVFLPSLLPSHEFIMIEAKSGRNRESSRADRQAAGLNRIYRYRETDMQEVGVDGGLIGRKSGGERKVSDVCRSSCE